MIMVFFVVPSKSTQPYFQLQKYSGYDTINEERINTNDERISNENHARKIEPRRFWARRRYMYIPNGQLYMLQN